VHVDDWHITNPLVHLSRSPTTITNKLYSIMRQIIIHSGSDLPLKLSILCEDLNTAVQQVSKALSSRTTIPILSGIKITATENEVVFVASDTDISIQSTLPIKQGEKNNVKLEKVGSIVVPGKLFTDMIRKLPSEYVDFIVSETFQITIRSGPVELQIAGLDPEEYPLLPQMDKLQSLVLHSDQLITMIKRTLFAVSQNESTPILTGVLWQLKNDTLTLIATDRHRLSTTEISQVKAENIEFTNMVVSGKNLNDLLKLLPERDSWIEVVIANNQILFKLDQVLFYSRLLDGTFPDTTRIIPQTFKTEIVLDTKAFIDAVDRAYLLSREDKTNIVRMNSTEDGKIELTSTSSEIGKIKEKLDTFAFSGEEVKISFNSKYMIDALKTIESKQVRIGLTGQMSPMIIKPDQDEELLHLILPYRTSN
jgi:DNA polymerase III subunit beta